MEIKVSLPIVETPVEVSAGGACSDNTSDALNASIHPALESKHDFAAKFRQDAVLDRFKEYVRRQAKLRRDLAEGKAIDWEGAIPNEVPVSINLDLTTACNYACDHCVDKDILNKPIKYDHDRLMDSLTNMAERGLKSVIVIGGGEPTVYPKFSESIRHMKSLGLQISVVTNGSGNMKIVEVADCLEAGDWVRLSLDSGYDDTFTAMHKPKKPITLDQICSPVYGIKAINNTFDFGYSFIITWKGAMINDSTIVENLDEIVVGAERAKKFGFDYISYKPFLTRAPENNAEIVDLDSSRNHFKETMNRIREKVAIAKELESETFKVLTSTNLRVMDGGTQDEYKHQPKTCHMQYFRQVLSPLGVYNCPVYRNQPHGKVNDKDGYSTPERLSETLANTAKLIQKFDASHQCKEVTCLYNHVNWWIEDLIQHEEKLDDLNSDWTREPDFFF
ncbi:MAG: radical SAM protein [Planctomycetota bacterium]|nr:radical SAM protein [Planctomycetota bacterium]